MNFLFDSVSRFTDCDLQKFLERASIFPHYGKMGADHQSHLNSWGWFAKLLESVRAKGDKGCLHCLLT